MIEDITILGMTKKQLDATLCRSREDIDKSNAINERYLFELQIAELRRWTYYTTEKNIKNIQRLISGSECKL